MVEASLTTVKFLTEIPSFTLYKFFLYGSTALCGPGPPRFVEVS
jgi:hypothetical protein